MGGQGSIPLLYLRKFTTSVTYVPLSISQLGIDFYFSAGMVQIFPKMLNEYGGNKRQMILYPTSSDLAEVRYLDPSP